MRDAKDHYDNLEIDIQSLQDIMDTTVDATVVAEISTEITTMRTEQDEAKETYDTAQQAFNALAKQSMALETARIAREDVARKAEELEFAQQDLDWYTKRIEDIQNRLKDFESFKVDEDAPQEGCIPHPKDIDWDNMDMSDMDKAWDMMKDIPMPMGPDGVTPMTKDELEALPEEEMKTMMMAMKTVMDTEMITDAVAEMAGGMPGMPEAGSMPGMPGAPGDMPGMDDIAAGIADAVGDMDVMPAGPPCEGEDCPPMPELPFCKDKPKRLPACDMNMMYLDENMIPQYMDAAGGMGGMDMMGGDMGMGMNQGMNMGYDQYGNQMGGMNGMYNQQQGYN